ncbi:MAG: hypothetical protein IIC67_02750 [Thaumarchaeota archaeon]|nr:hypothetical protein [Nitrososphaerota archaeon]
MDTNDAEEIEFLTDRLDGLASVRINLITMLANNQGEMKQMELRKEELESRCCPDGCTCFKCEDK